MSDSTGSPSPSVPISPEASVPKSATADFLIVGVGASAGGLEALTALLKKLPARISFAMIIVQHMNPKHESLLVELLDQVTRLPVEWAATGQTLEPGHIYVAPPGSAVAMEDRNLVVQPSATRGCEIDYCLRALARDAANRAVGVILSGNGADGADGIRAIKAAGGFTFAEDKKSAGFSGMPDAAIETGCIDHVMAPENMAEELVRLADDARVLWPKIVAIEGGHSPGHADSVSMIFRLLAGRTGVDFSEYKDSTIRRRLARRMMLAKTTDLSEYVKLLQKNRDEVDLLFETLLINVTEFFRDRDYFDFLRERVLPPLISRRMDGTVLRVWVPGCATGEEAYSLAIVIHELLEEQAKVVPVQIFATDISEHVISTARAGVYSTADIASVAAERLRRFFVKTERGYTVQKSIRDMCIFARQNVLKDSPFSRLDLISCRNLLIYFSGKLQRKLIPVFHYALQPEGCLVLGSSESVGGYPELFDVADRRFRVYIRKATTLRSTFEFSLDPLPQGLAVPPPPFPNVPDEAREPFDIMREADRIVLNRHAPTGVLINDDMEIVQFRGDVSAVLAPAEGRASLNLLKMAREGLAGELHDGVRQAREQNIRIRKSGVSVMQGDTLRSIDIDVTPIEAVHSKERFFLVLFTPAEGQPPLREPESTPRANKSVSLAQIEQLRQDLHATRNYLQDTIEKHEATNQELRAANEEVQSSNEELQSTNEELETAKEELQSTNEELTTLNEELHRRQVELMQVNNDLNNLINSVHLPIIILGQDMRIRRFTPMTEKLMRAIPTDIGRPFSDIKINLDVKELPQLMNEVMDSLVIRELEVQDDQGRWYSLRVRPYRTAENKIDGVVLTLIDIDDLKRAMAELEEARDLARAVVDVAHEPLVVLNPQLRIKTANEAFCRLFATTSEASEGRPLFDLINGTSGDGDFRAELLGVLPTGVNLADRLIQIDLPAVGPTNCYLNAHRVTRGRRVYPLIVVSLQTEP